MTTRRGLAIGCGGILGFAWTAVALAAVERALDWDARTAEVLIGTSAGAEIAAALGSGRTPADLLAALDGAPATDPVLTRHVAVDPGRVPPLPAPALPGLGLIGAGLRTGSPYTALAGLLPRGRGDARWLRDFGSALTEPGAFGGRPERGNAPAANARGAKLSASPDAAADAGTGSPADGRGRTGAVPGQAARAWVDHPATWLVAADAATGDRVAFGSPGAPPADLGAAIAASWAIPGWFPPVRIAGRDYVDGGAVSSVSADLLLPLELDEVVVVAPMTSAGGAPARGLDRAERLLRRQMTRGLDREVAALRAAGTRVIRVEPSLVDLAVMGPNFMEFSRRAATLEIARRTTSTRVAAAIRAAHEGATV
ncbi:patatin-like phospholipase family protein [Nocardia rhizosphaerae]|uniref:Patatin-like phospholipase family protein n=1 Tax=Nocardia rhizosphaerae TaxID=1691571 RepID=A0ABV8L9E3_9NOCA